MLLIRSWPSVILHLDGDAFFANVYQAVYPSLRGKPVVTGSERGLATAVSYEARKYGIKRGMLTWQIRKICPSCTIIDSDYHLYSLFSQKMFTILRDFTPTVEEYSIDEGFADLKGLRRPLHMDYEQMGIAIRNKIRADLGLSVSVGISLTKSLAKLASSSHKPFGSTIVKGNEIEQFVSSIPVGAIWGVGPNTASYLVKMGIRTVLDFITKPEQFICSKLTKPHQEIWHELRGKQIFPIDTRKKETYKSMTSSQTFSPSTNDKNILWARLLEHVEAVFKRAREYHYAVGKMLIFLKTQTFHYHATELTFSTKVTFPYLIRNELHLAFEKIYKVSVPYRTSGCTIYDFSAKDIIQRDLFTYDNEREEKIKKIYPLYESHQIQFGSSLFAEKEQVQKKSPDNLRLPLLSLDSLRHNVD